MSRHLFFGANTCGGFYQTFGDILFFEEAQRIIYLKGSSGSGKSTLMRKVAATFETLGSEVDYIHCSNAADDLDGICVRDYGVSMVDATAPHVCDPVYPVALDEIVNLAEYIDEDLVIPHAAELIKLQKNKLPYYEKAYRYLNAAGQIYDNNASICNAALSHHKLSKCIARELELFAVHPDCERPGRNRRMFAAAITPQGRVSYLDTLLDGYQVIMIDGQLGMGFDELLKHLGQCVNEHGMDTETCYLPWAPQRAEHLFIPSLGLCYLTAHEDNDIRKTPTRIIDLGEFCDQNYLSDHHHEYADNRKVIDDLLRRAMDMMAAQKDIHDAIENIYVPSMCFAGLDNCAEQLITRLTALPRKNTVVRSL